MDHPLIPSDVLTWAVMFNLVWTAINCLTGLIIIVKLAYLRGLVTALSNAVMHVARHQRRTNGDSP